MASSPSTITMFPFQQDFEDNCIQRATTVNDTILSAIRTWIVTKKGSRLGNMVGCFLPDIIHDLINITDLDSIATQLKNDAILQFPGVNFLNIEMNIDTSNKSIDLIIKITFSTVITEITQFTFSINGI